MKLGTFEPPIEKQITQFGSQNLKGLRIAQTTHATNVTCLQLGANGLVGRHQAVNNQLFLVVTGSGWVCGDNEKEIPISAGQGAFWQAGEWHTTRTEQGLTAIVVEGPDVIPLEN